LESKGNYKNGLKISD